MNPDTMLNADGTTPAPGGRWYLQGIWPLVLAIPALTVVAGLSTVWIANYKPDPIIQDPTRPDIVAMHADPVPDSKAVALGLSGELAASGGKLHIVLRGLGQDAPAGLKVVFAHAAKETDDQTADAVRTGPGTYEAATPALVDGPWYVEVAPADRAWRLTGVLREPGTPMPLKARGTP